MSLIRIFILISGMAFVNTSSFEGNFITDHSIQNKDFIELIINNIRSSKGVLQIALYTSDAQYPDNPKISLTLPKDSLVSGRLRTFIPLKEYGPYSISILDDENVNEKMDYRMGVFPKEGFGFSNNPRIKGLKEPTFAEKSFIYNGGKKVVTINMVYIL